MSVVGTELVVGGRLILARPFIEFVPLYRSRAPATFQIALDDPLPKFIDLGGEIVQLHLRANSSAGIAKGIALFPGPKSPFNYNILPGTK